MYRMEVQHEQNSTFVCKEQSKIPYITSDLGDCHSDSIKSGLLRINNLVEILQFGATLAFLAIGESLVILSIPGRN